MSARTEGDPPDLLADLDTAAHLWIAEPDALPVESTGHALLDLLTPEELTQYRRFQVNHARRLFLTGRALARTTLSRYAAVDPRDWRFAFNRHGRPEIAEPRSLPALRFNLSHTEGRVACLVTLELDAGVDVEDSRRITKLRRLAEHSFSAAESADVASLPATERRRRFFSYWTLKEAYIKARGVGISLGLARFSFAFPSPGTIRVDFDPVLEDDAREWQFHLFRATEFHFLATAVRRGERRDLRIVTRRVNLADGSFATYPLVPIASTEEREKR